MCITCIIHHSWGLQSLELIPGSHKKTVQSTAKGSHFLCHILGMFALSVADKGWAIAPRPGQISAKNGNVPAFMNVASLN